MKYRHKFNFVIILIFITLQGISGNEPPTFLSQPLTAAAEFELYYYTVIVSDPDPDDTLTVFMGSDCDWLSLNDYGNDTALLAGFPAYYFSAEPVALGVSDGKDASWQNFDISLYCINTAPQIISEPVLSTFVDSTYSYQLMGLDFNDAIQFSAIEKPDWLLLNQTNDESALLSGIPALSDTGIHTVSIKARRANGICEAFSYQNFEIEVKGNSINGVETNAEPSGLSIYPNPAPELLYLESKNAISSLTILDLNGSEVSLKPVDCLLKTSIEIHTLPAGIYLIQVFFEDGQSVTRTFLKE
jgi:hypothetical protein